MNTPNFGAILDKAPTEISRPKPLPIGSYTMLIKGLPKFDKSTKKQTEYVEWTLQFLAPGDDVDTDELQASLTKPSGDVTSLSDRTIRATYYITEDALWRLKEFLRHCGFDVDSDDLSMRQMIAETPGRQVGIHLKHVPSEDGQSMFANIDKTFSVE